MPWEFDSATPIYLQAAAHIRSLIVCGHYAKNEKLPAVRELAVEAAVNPNTMQRAFALLESEGLVTTAGTAGRYVTSEDSVIEKAKLSLAKSFVDDFTEKMTRLGYSLHDAAMLVEHFKKEDIGNGYTDS